VTRRTQQTLGLARRFFAALYSIDVRRWRNSDWPAALTGIQFVIEGPWRACDSNARVLHAAARRRVFRLILAVEAARTFSASFLALAARGRVEDLPWPE
jgi:hypothetical protein